ncbi:shikimate dehydrogenase [Halonatronum saccharophilum]|uniref:shikimate dehydrogenase n=1 Tax=Halonatronum saccharophilum TaxID=150060 RepID=UPI000485BC88|nr:shikimate dehydrogenase [Halonatronum saccharophilum]
MEETKLELDLSKVKVTGLFGYPVEHSLSPAMHNAAFKELGLDYIYLPYEVEVDNVKEAVCGIKGLGMSGVNVTIPHKEQVTPYLDRLSEEAKLIGAVNTIQNKGGELIGHNTDGRGFIRSLREEGEFDPKGKSVLIIGAGGASRAVAFQLGLEGAKEIFINDLDIKVADDLASDVKSKLGALKVESVASIKEIAAGVDLIVDATPIGMFPKVDVSPILSSESLNSNQVIYDLVYNPKETVLLKEAKKVGAKGVSGLGMLLYQGAIAFEIWTGEKAPVKVMRKALERGLFS